MKGWEGYETSLPLIQPILAVIAGRRIERHHISIRGRSRVRIDQRLRYTSRTRRMHNPKRFRGRFFESFGKWNMRVLGVEKVFYTRYLDYVEVSTVCNDSHCRRSWSR